MFHPLRDRFKEYMSYELQNKIKEPISKNIIDDMHNTPIKYEIYYGGTDVLVNTFTLFKQEVEQSFKKALILNLVDVLEVSMFNIKLISASLDTVICDISYSGKQSEYIRHEIKKLDTHVYDFDPDDYAELYPYVFGL